MPPHLAKQQEEFTVPSQLSKSKLKTQKMIRKQNLRNKANIPKMIVDSQNEDPQQKQEQMAKRKARKWWKKFDAKYFAMFENIEEAQKIITKVQESSIGVDFLGSFFQQQYCTQDNHSLLTKKDTIRVVFRRQVLVDQTEENLIMTYEINDEVITEMQDEETENSVVNINGKEIELMPRDEEKLSSSIGIWAFKGCLGDIRGQGEYNTPRPSFHPQPLSTTLIFCSSQHSQPAIQHLLQHQKQVQSPASLQQQIKQWTYSYHKIFQQNERYLQILAARIEENLEKRKLEEQLKLRQEQIVAVTQQELLWSQILLLFKKGHNDKTEQLLNDALEIMTIKEMTIKESLRKKGTRIQKLKSLFETDCKICFSPQNDEHANKVFYCDGCNTSFHQICYGISKVQAEEILKMDKFYCDVCTYSLSVKPAPKRKQTTHNLQNPPKSSQRSLSQAKSKKPCCQLCCKSNFPMKLISNHFFHVTCLFMFDFAQVDDSEIRLRDDCQLDQVLIAVMENQMNSGICDFCLKYTGMKFKCCGSQCQKWYHPICAYLNGIYFNLERNFRKLKVNLFCQQHQPTQDRNIINQVYIRRFFCDYKKTSNMTQEEFNEVYLKELKQLNKSRARELYIEANRNPLLKKPKIFPFSTTKTAPSIPHNILPTIKRNASQNNLTINYENSQNKFNQQQSLAQSSQLNELDLQRNEMLGKMDHGRFIEDDLGFD